MPDATLIPVSSRCFFLPNDPTADRPCLGVVRGDRLTLRVDAGNSPDHSALMERLMRSQGLPESGLLALTHSHWDHTYGMSALRCPAVACRETQAQLERMGRWRWTPEAMAHRLETGEDIRFCHDAMLVEYPDPTVIRVRTADMVFDDHLTLDLGGVHAELLRLPNSHAADCVVVLVPEERVIFTGDICYEDLHHTPPCVHTRRYRALQEALKALDFDMAVPGHQPALTKAALLQDMEDALPEIGLLLDD